MTATAHSAWPDPVKPALRARRDRRGHFRIPIQLAGRFLDRAMTEHPLTTVDVSCSGACVIASERPAMGSEIVCYLGDLGRVVCRVVRETRTGFAVQFTVTRYKREKLADRLTWLWNRDRLNLREDRDAERQPVDGPAQVHLPDGRAVECRVVDISLTGAGFEVKSGAHLPRVGDVVSAGTLRGEVVRASGRSFGIRFLFEPAPPPGTQTTATPPPGPVKGLARTPAVGVDGFRTQSDRETPHAGLSAADRTRRLRLLSQGDTGPE